MNNEDNQKYDGNKQLLLSLSKRNKHSNSGPIKVLEK